MAQRDLDAYYTPKSVAALLASVLTDEQRSVGRAADFAVGTGVLLDELARVDSGGELHGTDVDGRVVRQLRTRRPNWRVGKCNFLDEASHRRCAVTKLGMPFDTIALNPPYSYRGGAVTQISVAGHEVSCSPAASFVGLASRYSHAQTHMAAVIPKGSLTAERDVEFWQVMNRSWRIDVVEELRRGWLTGTNAKAVVIHLKHRSDGGSEDSQRRLPRGDPVIEASLIRGCTPMHKVALAERGMPMLHTTSLTREGPVPFQVRPLRGRTIRGPAVLVPRVGQPVDWKIQIFESKEPCLMSDCVIGLQCLDRSEAEDLHARICDNWDAVRTAWGGSCAPYVTIERLGCALRRLGIERSKEEIQAGEVPEPVKASADDLAPTLVSV